MRLINKSTGNLFDTLVMKLSTEEILSLIPEFEKLADDKDYKAEFQFIDNDDKKLKSISFPKYVKK